MLNGYVFGWDGDWHYHFGLGLNKDIEWCEIRASKSFPISEILEAISDIGLVGIVEHDLVRVFGYVVDTSAVAKLKA